MSAKAKYIIYSILDYGLTLGGSLGVVVYNCIVPTNSLGYKLTLGGIVILVLMLFFAKAVFEKHYRQKYDTLLQQLAEATDPDTKTAISEALNKHKRQNYIYQRLMIMLPFAVLYIVTWLGATSLEALQGTVGFVLLSIGTGSIFNVLKKPLGEQMQLAKITKKAKKE